MLELPPSDIIQIGIDEAGRGSLAFPVCSAAVVLPTSVPDNEYDMNMIELIKDSKKMSKTQRISCAHFIKRYAIAYAVNFASVDEIDSINIMNATFLSMHRCIETIIKMPKVKEAKADNKDVKILVDGDRFRPYFDDSTQKIMSYECVSKGDSLHMNIAAASILAKVGHDDIILDYCRAHPDVNTKYGFSSHMAYGTKHHLCALRFYGPLDVHRKSFGPVKKLMIDHNAYKNDQNEYKDDQNIVQIIPAMGDSSNDFGLKNFNAFKNVRAFRKDEDDDE